MGYREEFFKEHKSDHGWYECAHCHKKFRKADIDVDHIVPQKWGGRDHLANLQCLCKHCNRSKQASLKGAAPDYLKNNAGRAVKKLKNLLKK